MERNRKLSPKWRGPFPIIRIENHFQVYYEGRGREKIAHVRHCKKFISETENGKEVNVINNKDVNPDDSTRHQEGGPREDKVTGDLLTPKQLGGGVSVGDEGVIMQRKKGRSFRRQSSHHHSRKMTFESIEVCFQGSVRVFMEVSSFNVWVNSIPGPSRVIDIRGVGAKDGPNSQELGNFVTSVFRIEGAPGRWRRRYIRFMQKRCGHCLAGEGAVKRTVGNESERKDFNPAEMLRKTNNLWLCDIHCKKLALLRDVSG